MSGGAPKRMRCYECGDRIVATIEQAKRHGWTLWVGGATCKLCTEKGHGSIIADSSPVVGSRS